MKKFPDIAALLDEISAIPRSEDEEWSEPNEFRGLIYLQETETCQNVVYSSKPHTLLRFVCGADKAPISTRIVGRYGITTNGYEQLIRKSKVFETSGKIHYVGDIDPADMMFYLTLAEKFSDCEITFNIAVNTWLEAAHNHLKQQRDSDSSNWKCLPVISLSSFEREQLEMIERHTSVEQLVGIVAAKMLFAGYKLELEGLINPAFYNESWSDWLKGFIFA